MKIVVNEDKETVKMVRDGLKINEGYCPCMIKKNESTKCMCADFIENTKAGELCHCQLYRKVEE